MFEYFREPLRVRHEYTLITEFLEEYLFFHYTGEIRYHNYLSPLLVYKLLSRCTVAYYKFWREFDRSSPLIGPARVSTKFMKRYRQFVYAIHRLNILLHSRVAIKIQIHWSVI